MLEFITETKNVSLFQKWVMSIHVNHLASWNRTLSQDDINLLEIPEPPEIVSTKIDNQSHLGGGAGSSSYSGIGDRRHSPSKSVNKSGHQQLIQQASYQQSQSSTIFEHDNESNLPETILGISNASNEDKSTMNDLKNSIQKLENVRC